MVSDVQLPRSAGILLHPTSLPERFPLRTPANSSTGWPLAGQSWWQVLPLGPPDEHGSPYAAAFRLRRLARPARRPGGSRLAGRGGRLRGAPRVLGGDWAAFGGSLADQVRFEREWSALRSYARDRGSPADRRPADLRRAGKRRPRLAPGALPGRRRRGRPAGRLQRRAASCGAIRSTTGRRCARAATAGGSSASAGRFELVDLVRLDHFRGLVAYWSVAAGQQDGPGRPLAARARAGAARDRSAPSSARCRSSPRTSA